MLRLAAATCAPSSRPSPMQRHVSMTNGLRMRRHPPCDAKCGWFARDRFFMAVNQYALIVRRQLRIATNNPTTAKAASKRPKATPRPSFQTNPARPAGTQAKPADM